MNHNPLDTPDHGVLTANAQLEPAVPLWQRVPTRLPDGRPVSDFLMLIPRLRYQPSPIIQRTMREIDGVLNRYRRVVLYADLNLKINTLWVSVRPIPGICLELPAAVKLRVPEAVLIGQPKPKPRRSWRGR